MHQSPCRKTEDDIWSYVHLLKLQEETGVRERTIRIVLVGLGNLGRRFVLLLSKKGSALRASYGLDLRVVGAADSRGIAENPSGLDLENLVRIKEAGGSVGDYPEVGKRGISALSLVARLEADILCEASPVHLDSAGEPGISCIRTALSRGMHVVTPNKGPIVLAYRELTQLAAKHGVCLRFGGTVAGGLPVLYLGMRDLRGATIDCIQTIPNLVTGLILDLLGEGITWEDALTRVRTEGVLEADEGWDIDGWDAAAKLVILANSVLGFPARLEDVKLKGIREIDPNLVRQEVEHGRKMRLVAVATRTEKGKYTLVVEPCALPVEHPLGRLGRKEMGIVYHTDIYGTITAIIKETTPVPSAATMLRDILDITIP